MTALRVVGAAVVLALAALFVSHFTAIGSLSGLNYVRFPASAACAPPADHASVASATTGVVFKGDKTRTYPGPLAAPPGAAPPEPYAPVGLACSSWAVVTTIFEPSPAILQFSKQAAMAGLRRLASQGAWCIVIVGDKKTDEAPYQALASAHPGTVVFLSAQKQTELTKYFALAEKLRWNHFGRKNLGYLFAIAQKPKAIWDFDDDNILLGDRLDVPDGQVTVLAPQSSSRGAFNPYVVMGAPHKPCWPRGLSPLAIRDNRTWGEKFAPMSLSVDKIGVIQSLAQHEPDVDAIYRLVQPHPFSFPTSGLPVKVPEGAVAPFNAQATMWFPGSFWGLLLPVTVHGRVSDIWRSFLAQALMKRLGKALVFWPPLVTQLRNAHNYMGDFDAELQLYKQADSMVAFVSQFAFSRTAVPDMLREISVALYEREFYGLDDVRLMDAWIMSLDAVGYQWETS